jgi:DNA-binding NtrC family response regulator
MVEATTTSEVPLSLVIVDDNATTVKLAKHIFEEGGWSPKGFTKPSDALSYMQVHEPDFVLTDFRMPEMNGPEFIIEVRKLYEGLPVLIMTSFDDAPEIRVTLRKAGVPCINKARGMAEVLSFSNELIAVRRELKRRQHQSLKASS